MQALGDFQVYPPGVFRHLTLAMICGNPKTGRKMAKFAIALFLAMLLFTAFAALRKKTVPLKEPPLHPSIVIAYSLS